MTLDRDKDQSIVPTDIAQSTIDEETGLSSSADQSAVKDSQRNPAISLAGCERIVIIGRTGSGKTTLGRALAAALNVPHIELDSLYFGPDLSTVPLSVLRERTIEALEGNHWVTDGNKKAVRDLVWPRADTLIWLDYPLWVSLWRLGKRALWRASVIQERAAETEAKTATASRQFLSAAKGVLTALRSHMGQRREYPILFAKPENQHLAVVRLQSPRATSRWLARVTEGISTPE